MAKKKEKKVNISGKPKHSLDVNRSNGAGVDKGARSAATVRRLKMYNSRPKRDRKGKILKHDLQSKELPNTRIEPDRRWFGEKLFIFLVFLLLFVEFELISAEVGVFVNYYGKQVNLSLSNLSTERIDLVWKF